MKRAIQREVEPPLGRQLLKGEVRDGQKVLVDFDAASGTLTFRPATERMQERAAGGD